MTRFKLLAAALGLVLATGSIAEATTIARKTVTTPPVHATKTISAKVAHKTHRTHIAHLRALHKKHLARHVIGHRIVRAHVTPKAVKSVSVVKQPIRHAMNNRGTTKPVSVIHKI